ncbi:MAG: hypothetical protein QW182_04805, partial [Thermosphaera sp.]
MNLSTWTLIVLGISIGYFLITTVIGFLGARRTKQGLHEFYVAGGTLSAVTVMFTYMAAYMEAWEFVGMPAVIVSEGFEWWVIETIFYLSYVGLFFAIGLRLYRLGKKFGFITPTD